jgi:hypothetical protein
MVNLEQLGAVVSEIDFPEIDPTRKNIQAHTIVQEKLMKEYSLLPMSFGMVAGSWRGAPCWSRPSLCRW